MEPLARHGCSVSASLRPLFPAESLALSERSDAKQFHRVGYRAAAKKCITELWNHRCIASVAGAQKTFPHDVESNPRSYNRGGPPILWKRAIQEGQSRWR